MELRAIHARAMLRATTVTIIFITVITIIGELYPPLLTLLKNIFSHHWLGKSVLGIVIFGFVYMVHMMNKKPVELEALLSPIRELLWVMITCSVALFLFYFVFMLNH